MPLASYVLSLCLHIGIILIIWLWPASKPLVYPEQPVMISLVDGAPGGNKEPSPILGPMGAKADGESAPAPAAKKAEVAQQEREETRAAPIKAPKDERPMKKEEPKKPELKPAPKQEVQPKEKAISPKKKDIKKDEEKPKPQAKPQEQKQDQKQKTSGKDTKDSENKGAEDKDAIASALNQARRKATSRTGSDSGGGSSVEQALAQARKNAGGNRGGGGGEGSGPGGAGRAPQLGLRFRQPRQPAVHRTYHCNSSRPGADCADRRLLGQRPVRRLLRKRDMAHKQGWRFSASPHTHVSRTGYRLYAERNARTLIIHQRHTSPRSFCSAEFF